VFCLLLYTVCACMAWHGMDRDPSVSVSAGVKADSPWSASTSLAAAVSTRQRKGVEEFPPTVRGLIQTLPGLGAGSQANCQQSSRLPHRPTWLSKVQPGRELQLAATRRWLPGPACQTLVLWGAACHTVQGLPLPTLCCVLCPLPAVPR
jgi:hypothetical protein